MSRIDPEFLHPDPPHRPTAADVLLRQEPDEEEEDDDDDDGPGDGYSESAYPNSFQSVNDEA